MLQVKYNKLPRFNKYTFMGSMRKLVQIAPPSVAANAVHLMISFNIRLLYRNDARCQAPHNSLIYKYFWRRAEESNPIRFWQNLVFKASRRTIPAASPSK